MKYKLIALIIFLSILQNTLLFTDNITGWDAIYHAGQTKIIYNEGTTSFLSPISLGGTLYNESPLVFYFTAYFARIFHLNIDLVIKYIPLFFSFTTLIALYYFFRLFLKLEKQVYLGLIIFTLITLPTYYAPCEFLLFAFLSLYLTYIARNTLSYLLIGIFMGISFLIHAPTMFILSFVIFTIIIYRFHKDVKKMFKVLVIVGSVYLLIISTTIIPAYSRGTLFAPPQSSLSLSTQNVIEITIPNVKIGEELNTPYLRKIRMPNILFFYRGCVGLFLLSLYGIYKKRKEVISLIIPSIFLILMGNIKYFSDKPFTYLLFFSIPLAVMGISSFRYKKALTVISIGYLLLFASKNIYLSREYDPREERYEGVSKVLSEGIVLTDPETRFYLTYHLGTTQCYPLNRDLSKSINRTKLKGDILQCLFGQNPKLLETENIKYIIISKKPEYIHKQTLGELRGFNIDVQTFKAKINSVDWTEYGYSLRYEDEYVKLYEVK